MAYDLQKAIEKATKDGKLDATELMKLIDNEYVNPIVAKSKPNMDKLKQDIMDETKQNIFKELNIEGVDSEETLKQLINSKSTKATENETKLQEALTKLGKVETDYKGFETKFNEMLQKNTLLERTNAISGKFEEKYHDIILSKIDSKLGEDGSIAEVIEELQTDYPEFMVGYKSSKGSDFRAGEDVKDTDQEAFNKAFGIKSE